MDTGYYSLGIEFHQLIKGHIQRQRTAVWVYRLRVKGVNYGSKEYGEIAIFVTAKLLYSEQQTSNATLSSSTRQTCVLPAIKFTIDNGIVSALSWADVRSLYEIFSRNCRVLLASKKRPPQDKIYPVEALVRQTSTDFYKWYTAESGAISQISALRFELLDIYWHTKGTFHVAWGDLPCFQILKQNIWDSFWSAFVLNGAPVHLKISVSHLLCDIPDCGTCVPTGRAIQIPPILQSSTTGLAPTLPDLPAARGHPVHPLIESPTMTQFQFVAPTTRTVRRSTRHRSNIYQLLN